MAEMTAEQAAHHVFTCGLLDNSDIESAWMELGSRDVSANDFLDVLLRRGKLTNLQVERLLRGEAFGYFYGAYKILYLTGVGTFARVYRAVHRERGDVVAVKVLRNRYREERAQREQFIREAKVGKGLEHENIVKVFDVDTDPPTRAPYMVMEFVEGQNLREFCKVRGKLDRAVCLRLLADVVSGLQHAADRGITHRDLKMSNVLVTSNGRAKLVDFGLAAAIDQLTDDAIADSPNARSIDYAALERGTGVRKDDARSDIYFAGCILYHTLTGQPPLFETRDRIHRLNMSRFQEIRPIADLEPDLPSYIVNIVERAMELKPESRYGTPAEMLVDLKMALVKLEKGDADPEPAAAVESDEPTAGEASALSRKQEGLSRTVMIVESDKDIQDMLRDKLKRRGYRVLVISNPKRALERFEGERAADAVVFCTSKLGVDALVAFNRLGEEEETRDVPAVLLVDERHKPVIRDAQLGPNRVMLTMPLKVRELRATLHKLLSTADAT